MLPRLQVRVGLRRFIEAEHAIDHRLDPLRVAAGFDDFPGTVHPVTANLVQYTVGLAVTAPLALALEPMHVNWTAGLAGSLAYLVICNSLIAISLLFAMVRYGEASRVSALFFLIPPATALIALIVLGETIGALAWPGIALAAAGSYLVMRY